MLSIFDWRVKVEYRTNKRTPKCSDYREKRAAQAFTFFFYIFTALCYKIILAGRFLFRRFLRYIYTIKIHITKHFYTSFPQLKYAKILYTNTGIFSMII